MIKIRVFQADDLITEFESRDEKEISVGRAPGCTICLDDPTVSRLHAVIIHRGGRWGLQRKTNFGLILLNGCEVENAPLEGGEEIWIGTFSLRLEIAKPAPALIQSPISSDNGDAHTKLVSSGFCTFFRMDPGSANIEEFQMEKEVVLFGRASNCDVVLSEKKASRKHFEVCRRGLNFFLKDLNSANATLVNGAAVTEAELAAGDVIQVGESKIRFSIEQRGFFADQDQFLPVPAFLSQPHSTDADPNAAAPQFQGQPDFDGGQEIGPDGTPLPVRPNSATDVIGHAIYSWAKIPKAQRLRYLTILVVGCLVMAMLSTTEVPMGGTHPLPSSGSLRRIDYLSRANKKVVKENYAVLLAAHEKKDFSKMTDAARVILSLVDDYNDTKSYESIAMRGLEQIEEERKRIENVERQRKVHAEVEKLEKRGGAVFEHALADSAAEPELDGIIQEIYSRDPNNRAAAEWKSKVKDAREAEKKIAELARKNQELRQKAEDEYARVAKIYKSEKYIEAIGEVNKLPDLGWTETKYLERVEKLRTDIRTSLRNVLDPLLAEARNQRLDDGDLIKARTKYREVLHIDTVNEEARRGLNEIRQELLLQAKSFYSQAIIAESVSDMADARENYERCLQVAPDDENLSPNQDYQGRCRRKLIRYKTLSHLVPGRK